MEANRQLAEALTTITALQANAGNVSLPYGARGGGKGRGGGVEE